MNDMFPKDIYLCYKHKNIPNYIINDLQTLNPSYNITLFDDSDCVDFLTKFYDKQHAELFSNIFHGSIKADFWRVCVLNIFGGIYCDIDIRPILGFDDFIDVESTFVVSCSKIPEYVNPIILRSQPNQPVLQYCIKIYLDKFYKKDHYRYWKWSICPIMYQALFYTLRKKIINNHIDTIKHSTGYYQFLSESLHRDRDNMCTLYKHKIICYNHRNNYISREIGNGFI
jgi:mannosyltransferase OCH1-like enzyme